MNILKDETRKANKEHKCNLCHGIIKKSEEYKIQIIKQDDIYDFKAHLHCDYLVEKLDMFRCEDELTEDVFYDYVSDDFDNKFNISEKAKLLYDKYKGDL